MNWDKIVVKATPYVVKVDTPSGGGTGFICLYNDDKTWVGVATAAHVVASADEWRQPIRLHFGSKQRYLDHTERVIFLSWNTDSAVIFFKNDLDLPQDLLPLFPASRDISIGIEIGWLGFPGIARNAMCFFSGCISAIESTPNKGYLIDGVAINGVSGGPVLYFDHDEIELKIVGIVTAYRANRNQGDLLPGLSIAQDLSHFHNTIQHIRSIDEAQQKKREVDAASAQKPSLLLGDPDPQGHGA